MRQIEVQIMGVAYLLAVPENGEARLHSAVKKVDTAMCRIRDAGKIKARDRIAVLAALNLAFELADREAQLPPPAAGHRGSHEVASALASAAGANARAATRLAALSRRLDAALDEEKEDNDHKPAAPPITFVSSQAP